MRRRLMGPAVSLAVASLTVASCAPAPAPVDPDAVRGVEVGDPLPGLSPAELARFEAGRAAFSRIFLPAEGLGPVYNENSCNACHSRGGIGGFGDEWDIKASYQAAEGSCDPLYGVGGANVRGQVTAAAAAVGVGPESVPAAANQRARFTAPALWGRGLVEAIAEETLLALADPEDADGDGIAGRPGRDAQGRIGRFLRKASVHDLQSAAEGSVLLEFGVTTPGHPRELVFSVASLPPGADPAPEPEVDQATLDAMADYIRFLALPPRNVPSDPEARRQAATGEGLFHQVGCARCHVPFLVTGPSPVAALDRKAVPLYSDLLLHDMGPGRESMCSPGTSATQVRTEPLIGLAIRKGYMFDGAALDLWEAIALHGGTARASVEAFNALHELQRHALVAFLMTL